jgi:Ulp1 family protease
LTNLIKSPLTPDKERQLKEIIENKEQLDKIKPFWGESLTWGSMQKILNFDRKDEDVNKNWIGDEVVNTYCKDNLAQQDKTQCQQENGQKHSWFINSFYFKICSMRRMTMQHLVGGTIMKKIWIKKAPGNNIFNLKNIYFIINIDNNHWSCIVVYMEEKWIQYYDSLNGFGKDDKYLKGILWYFYDLDKKKEHIKPDKWKLVYCAKTVPQQKYRVNCGALFCMSCYYISHDSC